MADKNRFGNLMSGLNSSSADEKPAKKTPEPKAKKKRSQQAKKASGKPATTKADSDPKVSRKGDDLLVKSKSPDYEKGTYYLPKELTHQMRIYAVSNRMQMSDLVADAVSQYLKERT